MIPRLFIFSICLLLFSSCFRIEERVIFSDDGSGIFGLEINMSESKYVLQMAKNLAYLYDGGSPDEKINRRLSRTLGYLEKTEGISATQLIKNDEDFIYNLTFSFDNIAALNKAITQFIKEEDRREEVFFRMDKKKFERTSAINLYQMVEKEAMNDKSKIRGLDPGLVFKDVTYTTHYIFDRKVRRFTNDNARVSDDKKEIILEYFVFRDLEGEGIANKIRLR